MAYGNGWPFSESLDGYSLEARDDADAEQAEADALAGRISDHAPAVTVGHERCRKCGAMPDEPCGLGRGVTGDAMTSCGPAR